MQYGGGREGRKDWVVGSLLNNFDNSAHLSLLNKEKIFLIIYINKFIEINCYIWDESYVNENILYPYSLFLEHKIDLTLSSFIYKYEYLKHMMF